MRRIKDWIKALNIRQKFIFYSYLVFTPMLLLISVLLFIHSYQKMVHNEEETCIANVQSLSDSIEAVQKTVMELGTYITINTDINQILTADNPDDINIDGQFWLHHAPMQMLQDVIAINGEIKTIAIYPENGVAPYLRCMDFSSYADFPTVKKSEVYKDAVANQGKVIWRRIGKHSSAIYTSNYNEKIVMFREIYDLSRSKKLGFLVIGSSAEKFDTSCKNFLRDENEEIIVISNDGKELMRCGSIDDSIIRKIIKTEQSRTPKNDLNSWRFQNYTIYEKKNEKTDTIVIKIVPRMTAYNIIEAILAAPLAVLIGFLVGLYPITIFIANVITKPLNNLTNAMRKFKKGDFSQKVEVITLDEVGEASACFNEMVFDMKQLIDQNYVMALKEKESELDALQAQINPHFLYNVLDSLYWQTIDAGNEKVAEDIMALSDLFRLVLNRGEGIVTVQYEQELIERYLQIQKMRFGKKLEYKIKMGEEILEEQIPKLILQPFIENAIVHGFEKGGKPFWLSITGKKEDRDIVFYIEDTGAGMSSEQIEAIWKQEDARQYAGQRIGKYAIKNVKERLELKYHERFLLNIASQVGYGTMVTIRIPYSNNIE